MLLSRASLALPRAATARHLPDDFGCEMRVVLGQHTILALVGWDDPSLSYATASIGHPGSAVEAHGQIDVVVTDMVAKLMPARSEGEALPVAAPLLHGAAADGRAQVARRRPSFLAGCPGGGTISHLKLKCSHPARHGIGG